MKLVNSLMKGFKLFGSIAMVCGFSASLLLLTKVV